PHRHLVRSLLAATLWLGTSACDAVARADELQTAINARFSGAYEYALRALTRLHDGGNIEASLNLGYMYRNGEGVARDEARAEQFACPAFRRLQPGVSGEDSYWASRYYQVGMCVRRDEAQAYQYLQTAANRGIPRAIGDLATRYRSRPGDSSIAEEW